MAHIASTKTCASPNHLRSQSPSPRAANASKAVKKVPWVNPSSSKHTVLSSPSEIPLTNPTSQGGLGSASLRASFEHNENERDLNGSKLNKARSPAATPLKGTKNFMSPTISASSKVIAASPKRRILSERNDGTRSSLTSVSDSFDFMESVESDVKSEWGIDPHVPLDTPKILKASPKRLESEGAGLEPRESFNLQESLGNFAKRNQDPEHAENDPSVFVTRCSPAISSLDEDPALPPYDPKTNYLSPRPRFLHYRPKPRIEHYLNDGDGFSSPGGGGQLEGRFSSEGSEVASEQTEVQSSDEQNVCEDDSFPSEVENEEVREEAAHDPEPTPDDAVASKPKPDDAVALKFNPDDAVVVSKQTPKFRFFTRSKFFKLSLLIVVASLFVSVIDTPTTEISSLSPLKDESIRNLRTTGFRILDEPYLRDSFVGLRDHANLNFDHLANKFRDLSVSSIARFKMLIANFAVPREELGFFYLSNTTAGDVGESEDVKGDEMEQDKEQSLVTDSRDMEAEKSCSDDLTEKTDMEAAVPGKEPGFFVEQEMFDGIKDDMEDVSEDSSTNLQHAPEATEDDDDIKEEAEAQISLDSSLVLVQPNSEESGSYPDYQPLKINDEVEEEPQAQIFHENGLPQADVEVYVGAKKDDGGAYEPQIFHHANFGLGAEFPWQTLLGFISVVLGLAAIVISLRVSQKHVPKAHAYELSSPSKVISNPMSQKYMHFQSPSQSYVREAETLVGESGPSEVSSSLQKSLSFGLRRSRRGMEQDDDTFGHERDLRRDSVASSTSYGSFTTYERLSAKKRYRGDDDSLTPVRRSSRIRNQVTSP